MQTQQINFMERVINFIPDRYINKPLRALTDLGTVVVVAGGTYYFIVPFAKKCIDYTQQKATYILQNKVKILSQVLVGSVSSFFLYRYITDNTPEFEMVRIADNGAPGRVINYNEYR
jgi:hypothetical protein